MLVAETSCTPPFFDGRIAMPFRRLVGKYNLAVLIALACLVLALISVLGLALAFYGNTMSARAFDVNVKVIANGAILFGLIVVLIRQTAAVDYAHESSHSMRKAMQATTSKVEVAAEEVKRATNGDMDKRIEAAVEAAMVRMLPKMVEDLCAKIERSKHP